ncbi:LacI family DNA-binding transcriptional regulator [Caballeronia sp. dw_19]|uniref:LacI family DNA-binding transcriptional regulator n=1 Tax=Caballeronia sp. dw_19 TaxID=2719791 RepID=UPI001BD2F7D8|nr:LacI family DNA-binding transcriptional regulator [Caballeronia sp. dw_19]
MLANPATIKDVASRAGISVATVSHVLNGTRKVRVETRDRVFAAIEELGYSGHSIARSLRRGRTATLGLVVSDIENPFFAVLASHVQRAALKKGYQVIFGNSEESGEREREILDALGAQRVDGIILAPVAQANVEAMARRRIPLTLVNRRFEGVDAPHVIVDDHAGASLGFDHLWTLGHREIAIVHGGMQHSTTLARVAGVRDAYRQRGIVFDETRLSIDAGRSGDAGEAGLVALMASRQRPSAILALGNWPMVAAIRGLHRGLIRCPDDVSLVGYGVTSPYWMPASSISMVEQPVIQMADASVRLLFDQIEKVVPVESVMLQPLFSAGESSAPLKRPLRRASGKP